MSDWTACYRRKPPAASPLNDLGEAVWASVKAETRRRAELVESAILRCAERGQRVELLEYHRDSFGLDQRCDLIANGLDVATVVF